MSITFISCSFTGSQPVPLRLNLVVNVRIISLDTKIDDIGSSYQYLQANEQERFAEVFKDPFNKAHIKDIFITMKNTNVSVQTTCQVLSVLCSFGGVKPYFVFCWGLQNTGGSSFRLQFYLNGTQWMVRKFY